MDPLTIVAIITASLSTAEKLMPYLQTALNKGEITLDQQKQLLARYNALKEQADGLFTGPEWDIT